MAFVKVSSDQVVQLRQVFVNQESYFKSSEYNLVNQIFSPLGAYALSAIGHETLFSKLLATRFIAS